MKKLILTLLILLILVPIIKLDITQLPWKQYNDEELKFSFKYPYTWIFEEVQNPTIKQETGEKIFTLTSRNYTEEKKLAQDNNMLRQKQGYYVFISVKKYPGTLGDVVLQKRAQNPNDKYNYIRVYFNKNEFAARTFFDQSIAEYYTLLKPKDSEQLLVNFYFDMGFEEEHKFQIVNKFLESLKPYQAPR